MKLRIKEIQLSYLRLKAIPLCIKLIAISCLLLTSTQSKAQNGLSGEGFASNYDDIVNFTGGVGSSRILVRQSTSANTVGIRLRTNWDGNQTNWSISGGNDNITQGVVYSLTSQNSGGTMRIAVPNTTDNYVFKTRGGGNPPNTSNNFIFFRIQGSIRNITSVSNGPAYPGYDVTLTATLNGSIPQGQAVWARYTKNNWTSSTVIKFTGSGTTVTATIPASSDGTTVRYYLFTSGDVASIPAVENDINLYAINIFNNGGSNFNFTVSGTPKSPVSNGNWSNPSTWTGSAVPTSGELVIINNNRTVTIDAGVSAGLPYTIIESGASLVTDAGVTTFEFETGAHLVNTGTFNPGTSTVAFKGSNTIGGNNAITFNNIDIEGSCTLTNPSVTINGTLTFQSNASLGGNTFPTYGNSSSLVYNNASAYTQGREWGNTSSPSNVIVRNLTTITLNGNNNVTIGENLTIDAGGAFHMASNAATLTIGGNILSNGTLRLGGTQGGDLWLGGNLTIHGTFNDNYRLVTFNGTGNQQVEGSTGELRLPLIRIDKPSGKVIFERNISFNTSAGSSFERRIELLSGELDMNGMTLTFATGRNHFLWLPNDKTGKLTTGGTSITSFSHYTNQASTISLGSLSNQNAVAGTVEFSGNASETIPLINFHHFISSGSGSRTLPSGTVNVSGNFTPGTNSFTITGNTIRLNGASQNIGAFTFNNLTIAGTGNKTLNGSIQVNGTLSFENNSILTNTYTVNLGSTGSISGEANGQYVRGNLEVTRTVNATTSNFGNIGVSIASGSVNLGSVTILRNAGRAGGASAVVDPHWPLHIGINRQWKISPASQPGTGESVNLTLSWLSDDNNGKDIATAQVWKKGDSDPKWIIPSGTLSVDVGGPSVTLTGLDSFSDFTVSDESNPLPVTMLSFAGKVISPSQALLKWATTNEKNNKGFEVQKSENGIEFYPINFVRANTSAGAMNHYQLIDSEFSYKSYYRIKQIDLDGSYAYKEIILVIDQNNFHNLFSVYPNPTQGEIFLIYHHKNGSSIQLNIKLTNLQGQEILKASGSLKEVQNALNKALPQLPANVYLLHIQLPEMLIIKKIIKK
jgi:trimeric autotransporter adhesin